MAKFYLYDDDGFFQGKGTCPDGDEQLQAREGISVGVGDVPEDILYPPETEFPYDYNRRINYLPTGDQLDMLWHAMDDGSLTKVDSFYNSIKEVKDKYNKP